MRHFKPALFVLTFALTACEEDAELTTPLKNDVSNPSDASDIRGDRPKGCAFNFHC